MTTWVKNGFVMVIVALISGTMGWLLHLERAQADIRESVAQDYVTKEDLNKFQGYIDEKFSNLEQLIFLINKPTIGE
jgi:hypothetical protein